MPAIDVAEGDQGGVVIALLGLRSLARYTNLRKPTRRCPLGSFVWDDFGPDDHAAGAAVTIRSILAAVIAALTLLPATAKREAAVERPAVPRPGDRPDGDDLPGDDGRRPVVDHLRRAARRLLHALRRPSTRARFYTVGLDLRDGRLSDGDVRFEDVTTLLAPGGQPYPPASLDPEGLVLTKDRQLVLTSEGFANTLVDPFVRRYSLDGAFLRRARRCRSRSCRPPTSRAACGRTWGSRAPACAGRRFLFTATENALFQDGPAATIAERQPGAASCATTCGPAGSNASGSTRPTPSRSRPCPRRSSRSTGSSSCCRSTRSS